MGLTYTLGVCLFCISVWAVIQLTLMGFFYSIEASTLFDDVAADNFTDIIDYVLITRANFKTLSDNCYYAAYAYVATTVASWVIIFVGKNLDKKAALRQLYGEAQLQ